MRPNNHRWFAVIALLCVTTWALAVSGGPHLAIAPAGPDSAGEVAASKTPDERAPEATPPREVPRTRAHSTTPPQPVASNVQPAAESALDVEVGAEVEPAARAAQLERRWASAAQQAHLTPWAATAQEQMRETLRRSTFASALVRALECRGGMCRLEVESKTQAQARSFGQAYIDALALETYGVIHHHAAEDGRHLTTAYLADNAELLATAEP